VEERQGFKYYFQTPLAGIVAKGKKATYEKVLYVKRTLKEGNRIITLQAVT